MRMELLAGILTAAAVGMGGCGGNGSPNKPFLAALPAITMVSIPAGTFQMGDTTTAVGAIPVHSVTLGAFTISQTPVTQEQYLSVMGINPAYFDSGRTWPVESASWYDAALFCNALSKLAGTDTVYTFSSITGTPGAGCSGLGNLKINYTQNGYRLPTEAEYEYACRAGTTTDFDWGMNYSPVDSLDTLMSVDSLDTLTIDSDAVWYYNSPFSTQQVATKNPNTWGLYDMSGNVWEWCNDWFGNYGDSSQTNPTGATSGNSRVLRGGSWYVDDARYLCSAFRLSLNPQGVIDNVGFRVVCGARQ
jgi:formylglycine-generating enzyme required for sulfatase activity